MEKTTITLHNRALEKRTKNKENQTFEIWYEESLEIAYKRLFGKAVAEYNYLQTREGRKIKNYLAQVKKSKLLNVAYEMIFTMGSEEEHLDPQACLLVLKQIYENWKTLNPNLKMIGAYFHSNEQDPKTQKEKAPFLRIIYVPVAYICSRGPKKQTSLNKAFQQMGYENKGRETTQIQFERFMLDYFKNLVQENGIAVVGETKEKNEDLAIDNKLGKQLKKNKPA